MNINDRIRKIIDILYDGNVSAFCRSTEVKQSTLNTIVGKRQSKPSYEIINNIVNAEALSISADWLLKGKGEMQETQPAQITDNPKTDKDIKILDIRVCAGQGIGFDGEENKVVGYVNIPEFAGCYGITVYGDSMYDMYMPGDIIFVRPINEIHKIENGQPHVIITKEDRLLKLIHIDYANKKTILSSYNTAVNPDGRRKYPDMEIDLDADVIYLYKVVGKLSRSQM